MRRIACAATPRKWAAPLPIDVSLVHQFQIGFVHQGGRLQRARLFPAKKPLRNVPQLLIDGREESVGHRPPPAPRLCKSSVTADGFLASIDDQSLEIAP